MSRNFSTPGHGIPHGCHPPQNSFDLINNYPENTIMSAVGDINPGAEQYNYTELRSVGDSRNFEATVLRSLENIERKYNELAITIDQRLKNIEKMLKERNENHYDVLEPPKGFPLQTMEAFEKFENSDEETHNALQHYLEILGGQNYREALNLYIRASMTNKLAEEFSWRGQARGNSGSKVALMTTKMARIFFRALKNSFKKSKPNKELFMKDLKEVLRSYKQTARNSRNTKERKLTKAKDMEIFSDDDSM
ncbi:hypothetical protein PV327_002936 [Microctonus hyperodae]|uniref:DUF4806 domain-containing protein n=1 Tax=Microctonus hyperodae TaxID=165561 RepID=A0AA39G397_MICHY|nr:hypothetical protein PV327_002936 [Microctonus hyperodae]